MPFLPEINCPTPEPPPPLLFRQAERIPSVVLDGAIHIPLADGPDSGPQLRLGRVTMPLVAQERLDRHEQDYLAVEGAEWILESDACIRRELARLGLLPRRVESLRVRELAALRFIDNELVPLLRETFEPGSQAPTPAESPAPPAPEARDQLPFRPSQPVLSRLLPQQVIVMNGYVYPLVAAPRGAPPVAVLAGGQQVSPRAFGTVTAKRINQSYGRRLLWELHQHILRQPRAETVHPDLTVLDEPVSIKDGTTYYQHPRGGVIRFGGTWTVFLRSTSYIMQDEHGRLYRFPPVRLGIRLCGLDPYELLAPGSVLCLDSYAHPFVSHSQPGGSVCMPRDHSFYLRLHRQPLARALLVLLNEAMQTVCGGYHAENRNSPYRRLSLFESQRISKRWADSLELPIYPFRRGGTA